LKLFYPREFFRLPPSSSLFSLSPTLGHGNGKRAFPFPIPTQQQRKEKASDSSQQPTRVAIAKSKTKNPTGECSGGSTHKSDIFSYCPGALISDH
jgi:hypothetical protein